ncbi:hypothetical protein [Mucilaginibacter aquaedulcis]|uniref:hypothetical protein n=1 Tax=Mucilaginibacter aquaedulcis TaxID=1187081 RepID=UPI0025B48A79|nr:hypothetical protein [Mucilaginibacter aquaedulcis]MDN3550680.1 hypothetical protein [Mucilaginibacter aquaedulcis]
MKSIKYVLLAAIVLSMYACSNTPTIAELTNPKAALPSSFNFDQLGLKAITTFVNKKQGTTSTLYGNPLALKTAIAGTNQIVAGEVFALVTWKQQTDAHWFGANIPGNLQQVEVVKSTPTIEKPLAVSYARYEGKGLTLNSDTLNNQDRIKYILSQKPAIMP